MYGFRHRLPPLLFGRVSRGWICGSIDTSFDYNSKEYVRSSEHGIWVGSLTIPLLLSQLVTPLFHLPIPWLIDRLSILLLTARPLDPWLAGRLPILRLIGWPRGPRLTSCLPILYLAGWPRIPRSTGRLPILWLTGRPLNPRLTGRLSIFRLISRPRIPWSTGCLPIL